MYDYKLFDEIKSEINDALQSNPGITFEQEALEKDVGIRNDSPKFRLHLRWLEEKGLLELQDTPDGYIIRPTEKGIKLFRDDNFSFVKDNIGPAEESKMSKRIRDVSIRDLERKVKWIRFLVWLFIITFLMALFALLKLYDIIRI